MTVIDFIRWQVLSPLYWKVLWKIWRQTGHHVQSYLIRREEAEQEKNPKSLFNPNTKTALYVWNDETNANVRWFQRFSYGRPKEGPFSYVRGSASGPTLNGTVFFTQPPVNG